ncbi:MAG: chromate transporter [Acholeplasmataceae bacterium]
MIELILVFLYVGLFTIGGGMVAIPLIQQQVVQRGLLAYDEFIAMIAIAESTPGPIGINIATFVGYSQYGYIGAIAATTAFILPSFLIVSFLAGLLKKYRYSLLVIYWFYYLKAVIIGLIGYAAVNVLIHSTVAETTPLTLDYKAIILIPILSALYLKFKKRPYIVIAIGAVFGMIIYSI